MLRAGALLASAVTAIALGVVGASAQTSTNPDRKPIPSLSAPVKSQAQEHVRACIVYGAGFVQLPGTGACIKIRGSVTTDVTGIGN